MTRTVWITGASGLLGSHLVVTAPTGWRVIGMRRQRGLPAAVKERVAHEPAIDLASSAQISRLAELESPALVIHTAARTHPFACEQDADGARADNVEATRLLTAACAELRVPMVHCSTDLVFDGTAAPYSEEDRRAPVGVYAATKAAAEDLVRNHDLALIVRLPLMLGQSPAGTRSVDESLRNALARGENVSLFVDEFRTPIHTRLAASLIWRLVEAEARGLVHLAGATRLSRWQMGIAIAERLGLPQQRIAQGRLADFTGTPARCPDVSLDTSRLQRLLGQPAPTFAQSLALPLAGEGS